MHLLLDQLCSLERIYDELFLQSETPDWTLPPAIPAWSNDSTSEKFSSPWQYEGALTRLSGYSFGSSSITSSHLPGSTLCVDEAIAASYWAGCVTSIESSPISDIVQSLPRHSVLQSLRGCISKKRAFTRLSGHSSISSHFSGSTLCVADAIAEEAQTHRLSKWAFSITARRSSYCSGSVTTIESSPSSDIVRPQLRHSIHRPSRGCILKRWVRTWSHYWGKSRGQDEKSSLL